MDAPGARDFCHLLAAARQHQLKGWWEGVSKRLKPFGVIRNNLILCSEGHPNDYCCADVILDPEAGLAPWCRNANVDGDPYPQPRSGGLMRIYNTGSWNEDEGPWRERLVETLVELRAEVAEIEAADAAKAEAEAQAQRDAAEARLAAARASMGGGASTWNAKAQLPTWDDVGRRVELDLGIGARASGVLEVMAALRDGDQERLAFLVVTDEGREFPLAGAKRWRFLDQAAKDGGVK